MMLFTIAFSGLVIITADCAAIGTMMAKIAMKQTYYIDGQKIYYSSFWLRRSRVKK